MPIKPLKHARSRAIASEEVQRLKRRAARELAKHAAQKTLLAAHIARFWAPALNGLQHMILECRALLVRVHDNRTRGAKDLTRKTHLGLYSRSLVTASEVIELLTSGHGHGALTRWRTLFELSAFAEFIKVKGDEAASRYVDYYDIETLRYVVSRWPDVAEPGTGAGEDTVRLYKKLKDKFEQHKAAYGKEFVADNGWAAKWLPGRIKIQDIVAAADLDRAKPEYKMASYYVHAGGRGALDNVQYTRDGIKLRATASDEFISRPGRLSALSLGLHSSILVHACKVDAAAKTAWAIGVIADEVQQAFRDGHRKWWDETDRDDAEWAE